jgi:hypothetical protein
MYRNTNLEHYKTVIKNKLLRGRYKSGGDGIPIGALNVPPGSVVYRCRKNFSRRDRLRCELSIRKSQILDPQGI